MLLTDMNIFSKKLKSFEMWNKAVPMYRKCLHILSNLKATNLPMVNLQECPLSGMYNVCHSVVKTSIMIGSIVITNSRGAQSNNYMGHT